MHVKGSGSLFHGRIDVHEVECSSVGAAGSSTVYIAEVCLTEVNKSSTGAGVMWPVVGTTHAMMTSSMNTTVSGSQIFAQPPQQPSCIQLHDVQHTGPGQDYIPVFPRGLGFGFSGPNSSASFQIAAQAPITWQSSASLFGNSHGPAAAAWGWGDAGQ
jgi:hypothetical protein